MIVVGVAGGIGILLVVILITAVVMSLKRRMNGLYWYQVSKLNY